MNKEQEEIIREIIRDEVKKYLEKDGDEIFLYSLPVVREILRKNI